MRVQPFAEGGRNADAGDPDFASARHRGTSVMQEHLLRKADALRAICIHVGAQLRIGEGDERGR